jgi:ferredoxin
MQAPATARLHPCSAGEKGSSANVKLPFRSNRHNQLNPSAAVAYLASLICNARFFNLRYRRFHANPVSTEIVRRIECMATMITTDCINCGACEPECPNNAISQGETVFVIDPKLCTECVGFHDYEACAAVCPVDCCVTDPKNIESEEALIARARVLHPEIQFGENFESRFRKGQGKSGEQPGPKTAPTQVSARGADTSPGTPPGTPVAYAEPEINFVVLPASDSWEIPVRCLKCDKTHAEPVSNFMIGNVIFCPHCHKSMVVRDNLNFHIRSLLKDFYEKWEREQNAFIDRREKELTEFTERRAKDAKAFQARQRKALEQIRGQLDAIGESYDAPGRRLKKGTRFAWG